MPPPTAAEIAARLDRLPSSRTVWTMVVLLSLGGFFEFYDLFFTGYVAPGMVKSGLFTAASLGPLAALKVIAVAGFGTFVFATFAGLWVGVLLFGQVADRLGRREIFTWSLVWYMVCTAIMAFETTGFVVNLWRFIAGIGLGVQTVTIDVFIAELIPARERGRAFSWNQTITFCAVPVDRGAGVAAGAAAPLGLDGWRWVVLVGSVGAIVVWFLLLGIPESPRWLANHGRLTEADRSLRISRRGSSARRPPAAPAGAGPRRGRRAEGSLVRGLRPALPRAHIMLIGVQHHADDRLLRLRRLGADPADRAAAST